MEQDEAHVTYGTGISLINSTVLKWQFLDMFFGQTKKTPRQEWSWSQTTFLNRWLKWLNSVSWPRSQSKLQTVQSPNRWLFSTIFSRILVRFPPRERESLFFCVSPRSANAQAEKGGSLEHFGIFITKWSNRVCQLLGAYLAGMM